MITLEEIICADFHAEATTSLEKTTKGFSVILQELSERNTPKKQAIDPSENCCLTWLLLSLPACIGYTFQGKETYIMLCWQSILGMDYVPEPQREQPFYHRSH